MHKSIGYTDNGVLSKDHVPSRVVALGGGHGLSTLLRGLKDRVPDLTAIVSVADDGGSSGLLRQELGLPPPGDLRDCIAAMAEAEPLMQLLFQYRFGRDSHLEGHSFGNLLIAAMSGITGDFENAIAAVNQVLAVKGRILPSSLDDLVLCAESAAPEEANGSRLLEGEACIGTSAGRIERVYIRPERARGYPQAIQAILASDLVILGPGSLYTSVIPNLLIRDIREAIIASGVPVFYICNVATQMGETSGYNVGDHLCALEEHTLPGLVTRVLANGNLSVDLTGDEITRFVEPVTGEYAKRTSFYDLVDEQMPWRHGAQKLAEAVLIEYHALMG